MGDDSAVSEPVAGAILGFFDFFGGGDPAPTAERQQIDEEGTSGRQRAAGDLSRFTCSRNARGSRGGSKAPAGSMIAFDWAAGFLAPFLRSSDGTVAALIKRVSLGPGDVAVDLGCGDGAVLSAVCQATGCSGIGYDLDEALLEEARREAEARGIGERVRYVCRDVTEVLGEGECVDSARLVFLFLLPTALNKLTGGLVAAMKRNPSLLVATAQWSLTLPPGEETLLTEVSPCEKGGESASRGLSFYCVDAGASCLNHGEKEALAPGA